MTRDRHAHRHRRLHARVEHLQPAAHRPRRLRRPEPHLRPAPCSTSGATPITRSAASSRRRRAEGFEPVPLLMAWATPSGPVTDDVFDEITRPTHRRRAPRAARRPAAGAARRDGRRVAPRRRRRGAGPAAPRRRPRLADRRHARPARQPVAAADRPLRRSPSPTAPTRTSISASAAGRAASLLVRTLRGEVRPRAGPGQAAADRQHHGPRHLAASRCARSWTEARALEQQPGILAVSLLPGFAYADVPQMGPSVVVVADGDADLARREADRLAGRLVGARASASPCRCPTRRRRWRRRCARSGCRWCWSTPATTSAAARRATAPCSWREMLRQGATDGVVCLYAPDEVRQCAAARRGRRGAPARRRQGGSAARRAGGGDGAGAAAARRHLRRAGGAARRQARQSHGADGAGRDCRAATCWC